MSEDFWPGWSSRAAVVAALQKVAVEEQGGGTEPVEGQADRVLQGDEGAGGLGEDQDVGRDAELSAGPLRQPRASATDRTVRRSPEPGRPARACQGFRP